MTGAIVEWVWQPYGIKCQSKPGCVHDSRSPSSTLRNDFVGFVDLTPRYTCRLCGYGMYDPRDRE